jgi:hypothetical protein
MAPSLWSALTCRLKQPGLTKDDRAHIERWFVEADRRVWKQLAAATTRHGKLPAYVEGPYSYFIGSALRGRRFAESQTDTPAVQRKLKQQHEQRERSDLLRLAEKMEEVVRNYLPCRNAQYPQRVPSPSGVPLLPRPRELQTKQSLEWLGREAHRLRQLAVRVSADEPPWSEGPIPIRVSRQSGGKGKRNQSRRLGVFMQQMVNCMYQSCGKPYYDAVAAMTNIAFPDADVVGENVRSACKATTRTTRRKRCTQPPK